MSSCRCADRDLHPRQDHGRGAGRLQKVNRAKAGADAVGAQVVIQEIPGYMPWMNEKRMNQLFEANVTPLAGSDHVVQQRPHHRQQRL